MIIPVVLNFSLSNVTFAIDVDTDKMYERVAHMLQEVFLGQRSGPLVMSGDDMVSVYKGFYSFTDARTLAAVDVIQHCGCVREVDYFSQQVIGQKMAA